MTIGSSSPRAFRPERIAPPASLAGFFAEWKSRDSREAPVDLEIGCGVGWHAIRRVGTEPGRFLIAVERTREKFEKFRARVARNRTKSGDSLRWLFPVHADAIAFVVHGVPAETLDRVLIYYPNPCTKNPAGRWLRMPFFGFLLGRLRSGGTVALRTNLRDYFEESVSLAESAWGLEVIARRSFTRAEVAPGEAATHFERKYLERGETCFEWIARKRL
jgi:tRNA G46 methylase TrmB